MSRRRSQDRYTEGSTGRREREERKEWRGEWRPRDGSADRDLDLLCALAMQYVSIACKALRRELR